MTRPPARHLPKPGPIEARKHEMLRVDHAGEYGAVQIYRGQIAVFGAVPGKERITKLLQHMEQGEEKHLARFDALLNQHQQGPTLLAPIWNLAGFAMGAGTALLGEKAAMACTSAVEDVIEKHYAAQAEELHDRDPELRDMFLEFREEELEHKQTALDEEAAQAFAYPALKTLIQSACRLAIKVSEKL